MSQEATRQVRRGTPPPNRPSNSSSKPPEEENANPFVKGDSNKRKQGILELMDFALMPLAVKATSEQMKMEEGQVSVYALDLYTAQQFKDPYASIIVKLADEYPVVGLLLDRFTQAGPIASVLTLSIAFAAQLAENHKQLPEQMRKVLPVTPRDELARAITEEADHHKSSGNGTT